MSISGSTFGDIKATERIISETNLSNINASDIPYSDQDSVQSAIQTATQLAQESKNISTENRNNIASLYISGCQAYMYDVIGIFQNDYSPDPYAQIELMLATTSTSFVSLHSQFSKFLHSISEPTRSSFTACIPPPLGIRDVFFTEFGCQEPINIDIDTNLTSVITAQPIISDQYFMAWTVTYCGIDKNPHSLDIAVGTPDAVDASILRNYYNQGSSIWGSVPDTIKDSETDETISITDTTKLFPTGTYIKYDGTVISHITYSYDSSRV